MSTARSSGYDKSGCGQPHLMGNWLKILTLQLCKYTFARKSYNGYVTRLLSFPRKVIVIIKLPLTLLEGFKVLYHIGMTQLKRVNKKMSNNEKVSI